MYFFLHAILLVRLFFLPLQKVPFQRAADASESCGHCGQIDRSLRPNRAVVKILLHYEKIPPKGVICPVFIRILAKSDEGMT